MPHADASGGFGSVPFEEWLTTVASHLTQDLASRHHYEVSEAGSVSEAAALLLSPVGLAPDTEGHPTLAEEGGVSRYDDFESLAIILYSAAFSERWSQSPDLHIYTNYESELAPTEPRQGRESIELINAAGVLVQGGHSVLVFHEPALILSEMACESFEDLRALYRRILATRCAG